MQTNQLQQKSDLLEQLLSKNEEEKSNYQKCLDKFEQQVKIDELALQKAEQVKLSVEKEVRERCEK